MISLYFIKYIYLKLYFFPDILNNKDIRVNDLSYLIPPRVNIIDSITPMIQLKPSEPLLPIEPILPSEPLLPIETTEQIPINPEIKEITSVNTLIEYKYTT